MRTRLTLARRRWKMEKHIRDIESDVKGNINTDYHPLMNAMLK